MVVSKITVVIVDTHRRYICRNHYYYLQCAFLILTDIQSEVLINTSDHRFTENCLFSTTNFQFGSNLLCIHSVVIKSNYGILLAHTFVTA